MNHTDPSGKFIGGIVGSINDLGIRYLAASMAHPVTFAAGRAIITSIFIGYFTFNEQFRQTALATGFNPFAEGAYVVAEIRGLYLSYQTVKTLAVTAAPQAVKLGESALAGLADDAYVHFTSAKNVKDVLSKGVTYAEGGVGAHYFKVGDVKNLTPLQVKNAIGDLAGSSDDISAAVVLRTEEAAVAEFQTFQKAFWKEYVTAKQGQIGRAHV